jgi:hypothetical protein
MGKILSFVTLCIINFAVCRRACELDQGKHITMRRFKGLINGDDCIFRIKSFDIWSDVSSCVGLFNSVGKTFYSKDFIEMNSRSFILHASRLYETPFINWGLLRCQKRSSVAEDGEDKMSDKILNVGAVHRDLTKGLDFLYDEVNSLFRYLNSSFLLDETLTCVPYYIPEWLGGLGMYPGPQPKTKITFRQRQVAFDILMKINKEPVLHPSRLVQCKLDLLVNDVIKRLFKNGNVPILKTRHIIDQYGVSRDLEKDNTEAYNELLEQIWRKNLTDSSFEKVNEKLEKAAEALFWKKFYRNKTMWSRKFSKLPTTSRPIMWERLWHQPQDEYLPVVYRSEFSSKLPILSSVSNQITLNGIGIPLYGCKVEAKIEHSDELSMMGNLDWPNALSTIC